MDLLRDGASSRLNNLVSSDGICPHEEDKRDAAAGGYAMGFAAHTARGGVTALPAAATRSSSRWQIRTCV